jgi:hypothetical protein
MLIKGRSRKSPLTVYARNPTLDSETSVEPTPIMNLMSAGAVGAGALGLVLLLAIRVTGSIARKRRRLLLYLFKPGLYLTAVVLIVLVMIHAALAITAIYYGESALIRRIHIGIIAAIGLAPWVG